MISPYFTSKSTPCCQHCSIVITTPITCKIRYKCQSLHSDKTSKPNKWCIDSLVLSVWWSSKFLLINRETASVQLVTSRKILMAPPELLNIHEFWRIITSWYTHALPFTKKIYGQKCNMKTYIEWCYQFINLCKEKLKALQYYEVLNYTDFKFPEYLR